MTSNAHLPVQEKIELFYQNFAKFVKEKNIRYGNSALTPIKIFSKADAENSILIRLDDKLNRIMNTSKINKNDCVDLIGYLSLYCISKDWLTFDEFLD